MTEEVFQIEARHIGNSNILMPMEEFVDRAFEKYMTSKAAGSRRESTPKERKNLLKFLESEHIYFVGQFLFTSIHPIPSTILRHGPFNETLHEMGFKAASYLGLLAENADLKQKLIDKHYDVERGGMTSRGVRWFEYKSHSIDRTNAHGLFTKKTKEEIEGILCNLFDLPGAKISLKKAPVKTDPDLPLHFDIRLKDKWIQAIQDTTPAALDLILNAISTDGEISGMLHAAFNVASQEVILKASFKHPLPLQKEDTETATTWQQDEDKDVAYVGLSNSVAMKLQDIFGTRGTIAIINQFHHDGQAAYEAIQDRVKDIVREHQSKLVLFG